MIVRAILDSLAAAYARTLESAGRTDGLATCRSARRGRRLAQRAAVPAHRGRDRATRGRRTGRGDGHRQRARPGAVARPRPRAASPTCARSRVARRPSRRFEPSVTAPGRLTMRVALFITCFNDALCPGRRTRDGEDPRAPRPRGRVPRGPDVLRPDALQHRLPRRRAFRWSALSRPSSRAYDVVVTPSPSCAAMVRHHHATVARHAGDAALAADVERRRPRVHRADRVPRRRARGHRRRRARSRTGSRSTRPATRRGCLRSGIGRGGCSQAVEGLELVDLADADQCCGFGGTFAVKNADTSHRDGRGQGRGSAGDRRGRC